jgi:hypothetical protein
MPAFNFAEEPLYLGRFMEFGFEIWRWDETALNAAGTLGDWRAVAIDDGSDVLHAKLSLTRGGDPVLDIDSDDALVGGSVIVVEEAGSAGNPDPDDDVPASGRIEFCEDDTANLADDWAASAQVKRYWLDLSLSDASDGHLKPFGRGQLLVQRSPGGKGVDP